MNKQRLYHNKDFGPQQFKNFESALFAFFERECPQLGGERTRRVLVQTLAEMVHAFYPQTTHLRPGQTTWVTLHKDAYPVYGKQTEQMHLKPVILDLVLPDEARQRAAGERLRDIKRAAAARLLEAGLRAGRRADPCRSRTDAKDFTPYRVQIRQRMGGRTQQGSPPPRHHS